MYFYYFIFEKKRKLLKLLNLFYNIYIHTFAEEANEMAAKYLQNKIVFKLIHT